MVRTGPRFVPSMGAMSEDAPAGQPDPVLSAARSAATHASSSAWTVAREVDAVAYLAEHLGRERFLPPLGGWAVDYSTLAHLLDLLRRADHQGRNGRPLRLLELGSGNGTVWTASIVARLGGEMISVEHDEAFVASTGRLLEHYGLGEVCRVVHAPLTERPTSEGPPTEGPRAADESSAEAATRWYSLPAITEAVGDLPVDVLVVDGPPGAVGPMVRRGALPALLDLLADGAVVLLDDTVRDEEQEVWRLWLEELGETAEPLPAVATRARAMTIHRRDVPPEAPPTG